MARAGRNVLPGPVHRSELGLMDELDALVEAAGQVVLTSGHRLSELLWTRSGPTGMEHSPARSSCSRRAKAFFCYSPSR